ncbi:MAG: hypothetical protein LC800_19320 [Acidobacteria bacterium]|nr:hypothetical protein [Acidobacteriota bacterium]
MRSERIEPEESAERARAEAAAAKKPRAVPPPLGHVAGDDLYRKAYADVYRILSAENACSRFYGGPARAALVFNKFAERLRTGWLPEARTGSSMSGGYYNVTHAPTGQTYRLFEKAVLNNEGPFYRRHVSAGANLIPRVGGFGPATREARALILLHELGHLLRGADGEWLLKDDGHDAHLSARNTAVVEDNCGAQIRALAAQPDAPRAADDVAARLAAESGPPPDEL